MTDFDLAMLRLDVDALTEWDVRFLLIVLGERLNATKGTNHADSSLHRVRRSDPHQR